MQTGFCVNHIYSDFSAAKCKWRTLPADGKSFRSVVADLPASTPPCRRPVVVTSSSGFIHESLSMHAPFVLVLDGPARNNGLPIVHAGGLLLHHPWQLVFGERLQGCVGNWGRPIFCGASYQTAGGGNSARRRREFMSPPIGLCRPYAAVATVN